MHWPVLCVCAHVCMYMWKPLMDIGICFSHSHLPTETQFLTEGLTKSHSGTQQLQGCSFLCLLRAGITDAQHTQLFWLAVFVIVLFFQQVLGIQTKVLMLTQQVLYQLGHLPSLQEQFYKTKHIKVNQRINFHFTMSLLHSVLLTLKSYSSLREVQVFNI